MTGIIRKYIFRGVHKNIAAPVIFLIISAGTIAHLLYTIIANTKDSWARLVIGIAVLVIFIVLERSKLSVKITGYFTSTIIAMSIIAGSVFSGDPLTYMFLLCIAMICFTYFNKRALLAHMITVVSVIAIITFVFQLNLMGTKIPDEVNILIFAAFIGINIILYIFGVSYSKTLAMLAKANHAKSEFLATMSHEMKTPLTIIATDIQLAERHIDKGQLDEAKELIKEAWQETMHLGNHVTGALAFARSQELSKTMEYIDFSAIIKSAVRVFEPLAKEYGNTLTHEIAQMPSIRGNADMLTGALINLLTNANQHTKDGIIHVRWSLSPDNAGTGCLEISDNGSGIAQGILHSVFKRGVSGNSSSGLGLAIVKSIMESHGGEVKIESEPQKGTRVRLLFPKEK